MSNSLSLTLKNDLAELLLLKDRLHNFSAQNKIDSKIMFKLNLALNELLTNIILYNQSGNTEFDIIVDIILQNNILLTQITDPCKEFNPMETPKPDLDSPIDERKIGGLGVYIVQKITDEVEYERKNNTNIFRFKISL
jgi:anti-sigma regulatory factor (Ser/Thr protein kinase)